VQVLNRDAMLTSLQKHRRMQECYIGLMFFLILAIFVASLYLALHSVETTAKANMPTALPLIGSGVLATLLAFLRWLLKTHNEGGMLEAALHYASDEQLAAYVELVLDIKKARPPRRRATPAQPRPTS